MKLPNLGSKINGLNTGPISTLSDLNSRSTIFAILFFIFLHSFVFSSNTL